MRVRLAEIFTAMLFHYAILSCSILAFLCLAAAPAAQAQEVIYDSVVLSEGNANMSFYSLANGELSQVPLADWHLAADVRPMGASARINGGPVCHLPI